MCDEEKREKFYHFCALSPGGNISIRFPRGKIKLIKLGILCKQFYRFLLSGELRPRLPTKSLVRQLDVEASGEKRNIIFERGIGKLIVCIYATRLRNTMNEPKMRLNKLEADVGNSL
jgi:hypothetical protein